MSLDDQFEIFVWLFVLIFVSAVWVGIIRPFALRVIQASLYRLRDDLRRWYIELSSKDKASQRFSYFFMERAINSIAVEPGDVSIWAVQYFKHLKPSSESPFGSAFADEIRRFERERQGRVEYIDNQHVLIFICLLFVNSPLEFVFLTIYRLLAMVVILARGKSPLAGVTNESQLIRGASHQQAPFAASI